MVWFDVGNGYEPGQIIDVASTGGKKSVTVQQTDASRGAQVIRDLHCRGFAFVNFSVSSIMSSTCVDLELVAEQTDVLKLTLT